MQAASDAGEPRPLVALVLSDGRPGHFQLSHGIVAALSRLGPIHTHTIPVTRPKWLPGRLLALALNQQLANPEHILWLLGAGGDHLRPTNGPPPDVIVSAGGNTLAANIAAARHFNVPNIFYGSLRTYQAAHFTAHLTSYAADATAPNQRAALKPSAVDPDIFSERAPAAVPTTGLILGGPAGTIAFDAQDWDRLFDIPKRSFDATGGRWWLANGPRTPAAASDQMQRLAQTHPDAVAGTIDFRTSGPGSLSALFAHTDRIVCTADTSSMLSEAVWARRPVVSVMPMGGTLPEKERRYRAHLADKAWCAACDLHAVTPQGLEQIFATLTPLEDNPLDRLAAELKPMLPSLFAPR